jgi:phage terminase small subunit
MKKDKQSELTESQKVFCNEYILDYNGTRAYQVAYPESSYNTAKVNASKLLTNTNILQYIGVLQADLSKATGITKARILKELEKMAFDEQTDQKLRATDKQRAIEILNKMLGFNEPEKSQILGSVITIQECQKNV